MVEISQALRRCLLRVKIGSLAGSSRSLFLFRKQTWHLDVWVEAPSIGWRASLQYKCPRPLTAEPRACQMSRQLRSPSDQAATAEMTEVWRCGCGLPG